MGNRVNGDAALVTGASSGNGRAIARRLAEEGASVTVADIRETPRLGGTPTHELITENAGAAQFVETDVTSIESIERAVEATVDRFGSIDIMVNNAGITSNQTIDTVAEGDFEQVMDINLKGVYFGCQKASAEMVTQDDRGVIVNIGSMAGMFGLHDSSLYCASKAAVNNLTRQLALELGPEGIRVNSVSPGFIQTAMTVEDSENAGRFDEIIPLKRDGQPSEVADAVLYLASDESSYVNGHNLVIDGGLTAAVHVPD